MRSYTDEEWSELRTTYINAAVELVVHGGWTAVSVRNVGKKVGKSGTAIQRLFKGTTLQQQLVLIAFAELLIAIRAIHPNPPASLGMVYRVALEHLRSDKFAAHLMVRVVALAAESSFKDDQQVADAFEKYRARAVREVEQSLMLIPGNMDRGSQISAAKRLIRWYIATSVTLVTLPAVSDAELLSVIAD